MKSIYPKLSEEAFQEFQTIWQHKHPGQPLPPLQELRDQAQRILCAVELTFQPIPVEKAHLFKQL